MSYKSITDDVNRALAESLAKYEGHKNGTIIGGWYGEPIYYLISKYQAEADQSTYDAYKLLKEARDSQATLLKALQLVETELTAMYKRLEINGSNILDQIKAAIQSA